MAIVVQNPSGQTVRMSETTWERCRYSPRYARWRIVAPDSPSIGERDRSVEGQSESLPHTPVGTMSSADTPSAHVPKGVPHVIHHIWFGGPLPEEFAEYREGWRRLHEGWELTLWNESNLPPLINWACFEDAATFAQKADIARYEILYRYGGVYVDTDFECLKTITPLVSGLRAFGASESPAGTGIVSTGILGAIPKHPLFAQIVREIPSHYVCEKPPNETTGPALVTRFTPYYNDFVLFGRELFYPIPYGSREYACAKGDAFAAHHWHHSWANK